MLQMYYTQPEGKHMTLSFRYNPGLYRLNRDLRHVGRFCLQIFQ